MSNACNNLTRNIQEHPLDSPFNAIARNHVTSKFNIISNSYK